MKAVFKCLFICLSLYAEIQAQSTKPNILILFTDDHTYHALGALGNKVVKTPHMDELVKNGTTFSRASCLGGKHGALCVVSRAGILTGRYLNSLPGGADVIPTDHTMMPEHLKKFGYKTFATGKWHNDKAAHFRAFDEADNIFFGGMHFPDEGGHEHANLYHYDPSGQYPKSAQWSAEKFSSTLYADAAVAYLNQNKQSQQPFFAYVAFTSPHDPRTPPAPYDKMYDPNKIPLPKNFLPQHPFDNGEMEVRDEQLLPKVRTPEMIKKELAIYYGMISEVDAQIGRIIQTLKTNGQYDNTLIIFAGDNGLAVGSHGLVGKQSVYEHSMRVPLVMVGPGVPKNQKTDALCYLSDIFPTVCSFLGIEKPVSSEGKNLLEAIRNPQAIFRQNIYYKYRDIQLAVRTHDDWKLIKYNVKGIEHQQLFNLKKDPWETKNLAMDKKHQARLATLTETLKAEMAFYHDNLDLTLPNWGKMLK
ncbi:MAG: sulfatase-like hydrolase/transferase [Haliscomenobacter sp.]|uniref:sulfatase-like hydrolase/transferase n=1 Tax=Haliscomenobacter sp. TaxID=2717303 RepID=UPI0029B4B77E|nr:sulfatase-like hydrolase/transferase [Haliscomenobacter sp.]MDX2070351.1 sulfatase-like hydrolase/transferase [Haliscomenobacter sp.]